MGFVGNIKIGTKSKMMSDEGQQQNEDTTESGETSGKRNSGKIRSVKGVNLRVRYARLSSFITRIGMREIIGGRI